CSSVLEEITFPHPGDHVISPRRASLRGFCVSVDLVGKDENEATAPIQHPSSTHETAPQQMGAVWVL
ncbi:MAG: hypothetical protein J6M07_10830, partial [Ruminococcus sp.]|nr:hypothetical protein [Ruminococcus sp.]